MLTEVVQDLISDVVPKVLGVKSAFQLLQVSTGTQGQSVPDMYNWLYKWSDLMACLLKTMGESDESYEVDLTRLLQTVRYVTGEDAIITDFSQFKLQMVSKIVSLFNSLTFGIYFYYRYVN